MFKSQYKWSKTFFFLLQFSVVSLSVFKRVLSQPSKSKSPVTPFSHHLVTALQNTSNTLFHFWYEAEAVSLPDNHKSTSVCVHLRSKVTKCKCQIIANYHQLKKGNKNLQSNALSCKHRSKLCKAHALPSAKVSFISTEGALIAPKVLLEDLWPMITNPILSIPSVRHITLNELNRPKIDLSGVIKIFWSIEVNDLWSKKICRPKMIVWYGATFIFRRSCWIIIVGVLHEILTLHLWEKLWENVSTF